MAARIQAKVLFGHVQFPKTGLLWAEAMHWACEAMNHTRAPLILRQNHRMKCGMENVVLLDRIRLVFEANVLQVTATVQAAVVLCLSVERPPA